jgi:hypothetical protein
MTGSPQRWQLRDDSTRAFSGRARVTSQRNFDNGKDLFGPLVQNTLCGALVQSAELLALCFGGALLPDLFQQGAVSGSTLIAGSG